MANPRKFSEKIALLNQKEAEGNAEFERIMREVADTKVVAAGTKLFLLLSLSHLQLKKSSAFAPFFFCCFIHHTMLWKTLLWKFIKSKLSPLISESREYRRLHQSGCGRREKKKTYYFPSKIENLRCSEKGNLIFVCLNNFFFFSLLFFLLSWGRSISVGCVSFAWSPACAFSWAPQFCRLNSMRACWVMKNACMLQHKWRENVEIFFSSPSLSRSLLVWWKWDFPDWCSEKAAAAARKRERRYTAAAAVVSARKMSTHCSISRAHNFSLLFTDRRKAIRKCNKTFSYENKLDDSRRLLNNFFSSPFARAPLSTLAHASHQLSSPLRQIENKNCESLLRSGTFLSSQLSVRRVECSW